MQERGSCGNARAGPGAGRLVCHAAENMCAFIFVYNLRSSWALSHCQEGYSWGETLEPLGPRQEHNGITVIGGKFPNGAGWQSPRDLEGTSPHNSQSNQPT